jgi:hypothetical protein
MLATANNFVSSPLGNAAIGAIGSYLEKKGEAEQNEAGRQQTGNFNAANQLNLQSMQDRTNAQNAATPLGESQNFVAKNTLLNAILGNMQNFNYAKGGRPASQGGAIPTGGFDKGMLENLYGATPTLESLSQRAKQVSAINPSAPQENFANLGGFTPMQAEPFMASVKNYQGQQQGKQDAQRSALQDYINSSISGENGPLKNAIVGTGQAVMPSPTAQSALRRPGQQSGA